MSKYVSQSEAEAMLSVSRTLFEANFRPQLTAYPFGERAIRFAWEEIEALAQSTAAQQQGEAAVFFRRTCKDALDYAWRAKWSKAKGAHKKAQLMKVVTADMGKTPIGKVDYNALDDWIRRLQDADQAVAT